MAVAEVHERPATSPNSVSRRNSPRHDHESPNWRRQFKFSMAKNPHWQGCPRIKRSTYSRRPGCVNRALHHPRQEEIRRCRSQSGRCQWRKTRIPEFQPTWWLERLRSQVAEVTGENALHSLMHASRTEVGSELHQVQVELQELRQERDALKARVSATTSFITAEEADQLGAVVAELRRERSALKTQFAKRVDGSGKDFSSVMGTLIVDADADLKSGSSRFIPY